MRARGWLVLGLGLVVLAAGRQFPTHAARPATGFAHGSAQAFSIDPKAGGLSFGVTFGIASADQENTVAKAYSRSISLGLFGVAIGAPNGCTGEPSFYPPEDQPQPLRVDSRDAGSADGMSHTEGPFSQSVRATPEPLGFATTTIDGWSVPGVMTVGPTRTASTSGTAADGRRFASATSDLAELDIAGGLVRLTGLHWEATYKDEAPAVRDAAFRVATLSIAGVPVPIVDGAPVFQVINAVLETVGVVVTPPAMREAPSALYLDPLQVAVVPNSTRDNTVGRALVRGRRGPRAALRRAARRRPLHVRLFGRTDRLRPLPQLGNRRRRLRAAIRRRRSRDPSGRGAFPVPGRDADYPRCRSPLPRRPRRCQGVWTPPSPSWSRRERRGARPCGGPSERADDGAVAVALTTMIVGAGLVFLDRRRMMRA